MATRTQKAAMKQKADDKADQAQATKAAKADQAQATKDAKTAKASARQAAKSQKAARPKAAKPAKAKPAPKGKNGARRKAGKALAFEAVAADKPDVEQDPAVEFHEIGSKPGFFDRLKQRRIEKAAERAVEEHRREAERVAAQERQRKLDEKQRVEREAREKEEAKQRAADERKMKGALDRAEARAAKEAEAEEAARREAEAAQAKLAAQADAKARRAEEAAAEEAAAEEAKAHRAAERARKREELAAEERRLAEEQAARDAEEEVEARRKAANKKFVAEQKSWVQEPDLEFEEASKPVKESDAMVPAKGGATAADAQAELVARELAKRRSKPIVLEVEEAPAPRIPKAPLRPGEQEVALQAPHIPETPREAAPSQPSESFGFTIPEAFLLLANGGGWDERAEQNHEGSFGGALAGAMVLELLMRGQVMVQRDRIVLTGEPTDDEALAPIVARLRRIREKNGDLTSLQQTAQLAKANRDLLTPFKQRLADKGLATYGSRRHLGLFHRSWVEVTDEGAQERLQNRLRRAIAGGGTPEAASILLLGLLDAAGLFDTVVPDEAADYNRKRLNGLLGGRDIMGYKVDPELKALQEIATRAVLSNVRALTVRG
ncbi:MAG: Golgi phosphoprotein 3 [Thermoplasmata archaeon]|nr:Golgi phosphoprotein 3 [Thermoplasmata archaeon]